jgi:hypothetical protein
MLGAILLAAIGSAPTPEEVMALVKVDPYCASQEHSLADDCEVLFEFTPKEVRDLTCNETKWPHEFACSYNVLIEEQSGLRAPFWLQRIDQFRLMEDGRWFRVQEISPPHKFS